MPGPGRAPHQPPLPGLGPALLGAAAAGHQQPRGEAGGRHGAAAAAADQRAAVRGPGALRRGEGGRAAAAGLQGRGQDRLPDTLPIVRLLTRSVI